MEGYLSLSERVKLECTLETLEPLHVGSGAEKAMPQEVDQPIIVDVHGKPVVPGSTIKGFLRNFIASMLLANKKTKHTINVPLGSTNIELKLNKVNEKYICEPQLILKENLKIKDLGSIELVFGAPIFSSLIKISEAELIDKGEIPTRTHVSINYGTGTSKRGALVTLEYVPKGSKFKFAIYYDKLDDELFKEANSLFLILAKLLNRGIEDFLGGWKSRGYGLVKIKCDKVMRLKLENAILGRDFEEISLETLAKEWISR